jgi:hypothetical protein
MPLWNKSPNRYKKNIKFKFMPNGENMRGNGGEQGDDFIDVCF